MKPLKEQTYYELLEVPPAASTSDIRKAWERLNRLLDADNVALYPLGDPAALEGHKALLLEAMEFLTDPELRAEYDRSVGLPARPAEVVEPVEAPAPDANEPEVTVPPAAASEAHEPTTAAVARPPAASSQVHSTHPGLTVSWMPQGTPLSLVATGDTVSSAVRVLESSVTSPPVSAAPNEEPEDATEAATLVQDDSPAAAAPPAPAGPPPLRRHVPEPGNESEPVPGPVADPSPVAAPTPAPIPEPPPVAAPTPELPMVAPSAPASDPRKLLDPGAQVADPSAEAALALVRHPASARPPPREVRPRPVEIPPDAEFNGELLRQVRRSKGLSVAQLADRTRISSRHLENLEADRYDVLPPTVYLRGMLMSVSRELGLDSLRVAKSYLGLVEKQLGRPK